MLCAHVTFTNCQLLRDNMVNRITIWLSCFCAGAISAVFWYRLPSANTMAVMIAINVVASTIPMLYRRKSRACQNTAFEALLCWIISGLLTGVLWVASVGHFYYAWQLPEGKIQQDVTISGQVVSGGCVSSNTDAVQAHYQYFVTIELLNNERTAAFLNRVPFSAFFSQYTSFNARLSHTVYSGAQNQKPSYIYPQGRASINLRSNDQGNRQHDIKTVAGEKGRNNIKALKKPATCLHNGDRFTAVVKLKPAYGTANPVGFNRQQQFASKLIHATGYIKSLDNKKTQHSHNERFGLGKTLVGLGLDYQRWWLALLLGNKTELTDTDWEQLQRTGTGHLFSISGMHLSIIAGVCLLIINPIVLTLAMVASALGNIHAIFKLRVLSLFSPPQRAALLNNTGNDSTRIGGQVLIAPVRLIVLSCTVLACLLYAGLSGNALPVVRAFILLALGCLLSVCQLAWRPLNIGVAMLALSLLIFPLSMLSASFYLSVGAVGCIWFLITVFGLQRNAWYVVLIKLQLALTFIMMPLTLIWFGSASFIALVANLIALPFVTLILPIGLLSLLAIHFYDNTVVVFLGSLILKQSDYLFGYLLEFLAYLSKYELSLVYAPIESGTALCFLTAIVVTFLPTWRYKNVCAVLLSLPLIVEVCWWVSPNDSAWTLHVLDAGQATALMVTKGNRAIIIDSGAKYNGKAVTATHAMLPLLDKLHIRHIDHIIHTHSDNDHAGGADTFNTHPNAQHAKWYSPTRGCERGKTFNWQGLHVAFLWPLKGNKQNTNATSCVVKIANIAGSVLIPGDIEKESEYALITRELESQTNALHADVLVAPHHGSKTSSTNVFIEQVSPSAVIFTQGYENRWQFPAPVVFARYQENGVATYLSSFHGYISATFEDKGVTVNTQRGNYKRRWYLKGRSPRHLPSFR